MRNTLLFLNTTTKLDALWWFASGVYIYYGNESRKKINSAKLLHEFGLGRTYGGNKNTAKLTVVLYSIYFRRFL